MMNPLAAWIVLLLFAFLFLALVDMKDRVRKLDKMFDVQIRLNEVLVRDIKVLEKKERGNIHWTVVDEGDIEVDGMPKPSAPPRPRPFPLASDDDNWPEVRRYG